MSTSRKESFTTNTNRNVNTSTNINKRSEIFNSEYNGENIKVCLRIRPLNPQEKTRRDNVCIEAIQSDQIIYEYKNLRRSYTFNLVFGPENSQEDVFFNCNINKLLDSAINGYAVTIFAYGQTGSGKTYTIMGRDDAINQNILSNDLYSGIMPKSIKYIWESVSHKNENYYIKVSFLEIYNEQINDLLNPNNCNLQIRWDQKQGFFVEGLLVLECKSPQDIVEVILQGTKNRKRGAHDLNKDSSRSHCILTVYIICEMTENGEKYRRFGKVSFVDLAGSERLKESHSEGRMVKETGNINRSLFVLGKVISSLTEKRPGGNHIPYRDSKLTMLLMDSIGGTAKTLMIACVSPSEAFAEETISTLNYARRTMNIKNKPLVQTDGKGKSSIVLSKENELYRKENEFLRNQFLKLFGIVPDMQNGELTNDEVHEIKIRMGVKGNEEKFELIKKLEIENEELKMNKEKFEKENMTLIQENGTLKAKLNNLENVFVGSEILRESEVKRTNTNNDNNGNSVTFSAIKGNDELNSKNLETTVSNDLNNKTNNQMNQSNIYNKTVKLNENNFIDNDNKLQISQTNDILNNNNNNKRSFDIKSLTKENTELRQIIDRLESEKSELKDIIARNELPELKFYPRENHTEYEIVMEQNAKLARRLNFLESREKELLNKIMTYRFNNGALD